MKESSKPLGGIVSFYKFMSWAYLTIVIYYILIAIASLTLMDIPLMGKALSSSAQLSPVVAILLILSPVVIAFFYLLFIFRSLSNLRNHNSTGVSMSPTWAVLWHFIPIAYLWKPVQIFVEIANSSKSAPSTSSKLWVRLRWWWGTFLLSTLCFWQFNKVATLEAPNTGVIDGLGHYLTILLYGSILASAVSSVILIPVMSAVVVAQERHAFVPDTQFGQTPDFVSDQSEQFQRQLDAVANGQATLQTEHEVNFSNSILIPTVVGWIIFCLVLNFALIPMLVLLGESDPDKFTYWDAITYFLLDPITFFTIIISVSALLVHRNASRIRGLYRQSFVRVNNGSEFVLLLRGFLSDLDDHGISGVSGLERHAALLLGPKIPVVAIDNVWRGGLTAGALRVKTTNESWQKVVENLSSKSYAVLFDAGKLSAGIELEISNHLALDSALSSTWAILGVGTDLEEADIDNPMQHTKGAYRIKELLDQHCISYREEHISAIFCFDGKVDIRYGYASRHSSKFDAEEFFKRLRNKDAN